MEYFCEREDKQEARGQRHVTLPRFSWLDTQDGSGTVGARQREPGKEISGVAHDHVWVCVKTHQVVCFGV